MQLQFAWVLLSALTLSGRVSSQTDNKEENVCARSSCYPSTGDLLVGRDAKLFSSSTCGLRGPEDFCVISNLQELDSDCFRCDSRAGSPAQYSHLPKNMVILFKTQKNTWWQSENGRENVHLQLDFEAQFHVTHIVMKFQSFRPAAMLIERSYDYGKNWNVARYYAKDCGLSFPGVPTSVAPESSEAYCTKEYSSIEPSSGGEVVYKALNPAIPPSEAWTPKVQNLLRTTNIRINLTKLNTLGDDILDDSAEISKKYYYAINWITIRGSCSCYGHAERCLPLPGTPEVVRMVYSKCNCTHNTAGLNCERCKDGYHDRPWSPAFPGQPNECKKCDCHGHSDQCRFDRAVWEASGRTSGGVCIDCQHNTIGSKCDKCKPLHYQDPTRSIRDPDVCKPCDCDPVGSVGRGECQKEDKPLEGLRAGQCLCKANVDGPRCDRCKTGFFNLQQDNPDGCQSCGCNSFGTVGNACDQETGQCICKRFVVGQTCDRCKEFFWGLQTSTGCKPCECDVGGAYDNRCDAVSGQCRCRRGIEGRKCDRVIPGFYFALSDNLKYEGEEGRKIGFPSVHLLERKDGVKVTWTDVGSLKIPSGSAVEFNVNNIPLTGNYKLLFRFHPTTSSLWESIKVTVSRADGKRIVNGQCGNELSSNGNTFVTTLGQNEATKVVEQMTCLEKGVDYYVRIDFNRPQGSVDHVFLDSVILIPSIESVSIFQGNSGQARLNSFERYNCEAKDYPAEIPRPEIPPVCEKLQFSSSAIIYDGALLCDCHQVGSVKNDVSGLFLCDDAAGQCQCKPNVIGRRCDKCAPGSYNFGLNGCSPCNCDETGSYDNLCDVTTGQCVCNELGTGRQCNECPPKEWGFPQCRPCQCNGHAESCDPITGVCVNCQHNTAGDHCELCKAGYFGNALKGTSTDCQKCQCPGGSSENQFSPTCKVDTSTTPPTFICDQCPPGYVGKQCEECDDGYYGNPLVSGGECTPCNCSGNVDFSQGGGCDKRTGQCRGCLYNTAGLFCDVCKPGYYGNAKNQTCKPCDCLALGTSDSSSVCDTSTGQCPCKPNVVGRLCDQCAPGHWDLASGDGCKSCGCCQEGTVVGSQCDAVTGLCQCRGDFGGSKCCDCEDGFWGQAPAQCRPCDCNPSGSVSSQCNRQTGECECLPGVSGKKCNKCEVDTTQQFPDCDPCHPCYYTWLPTIEELERLVDKVNASIGGGGGGSSTVLVDYEKDLKALEKLRRRIVEILGNRTTFPEHVEKIKQRVSKATVRLVEIDGMAKETRSKMSKTRSDNNGALVEIDKLRKVFGKLRGVVDELGNNLTHVKGQIPKEALNESRYSFEKSTTAVDLSKDVLLTLEQSAEERGKVEEKMGPYKKKKRAISEKLENYLLEFESLNGVVRKVNSVLCGEPGKGCGGCNATGCNQCGGGELCEGAVPTAKKALKKAKVVERKLYEKETRANATLEEVRSLEAAVNESKREAELALELAKKVHLKSKNVTGDLSGLLVEIYRLLNRSGVDPNEIRRIAEFVLGRKLNISESDIKKLAEEIKQAVMKLTGLDKIFDETDADLSLLDDLEKEARKANSTAVRVTDLAKDIKQKLGEVEVVQKESKKKIKKAKRTIEVVENKLIEIETKLDERMNQSVDSVRITTSLSKKSGPLEDKFEEIDKSLGVAETVVDDARTISNKSVKEAKDVKKDFDIVTDRYNKKLSDLENFRKRAEKVRGDARNVQTSLTLKLKSIEGFLKRRVELDNLLDELRKLEKRSMTTLCKVATDTEFFLTCIEAGDVRKESDGTCPRN